MVNILKDQMGRCYKELFQNYVTRSFSRVTLCDSKVMTQTYESLDMRDFENKKSCMMKSTA